MLVWSDICTLLGALVLIGAGGGAVYYAILKDRARLRRLSGLISLMSYIRSRIDRYLTPIGEIFRRCDADLLSACFEGVSDIPSERPRDIEEFVAIMRRGEFFSDGESSLSQLAENLGKSYREEAIKECDQCIASLREVYLSLSRELPKKRKSHAVLGICCAAAIVIIII
jgi:hypothetical protein